MVFLKILVKGGGDKNKGKVLNIPRAINSIEGLKVPNTGIHRFKLLDPYHEITGLFMKLPLSRRANSHMGIPLKF